MEKTTALEIWEGEAAKLLLSLIQRRGSPWERKIVFRL